MAKPALGGVARLGCDSHAGMHDPLPSRVAVNYPVYQDVT
jgi:hypothetical protein